MNQLEGKGRSGLLNKVSLMLILSCVVVAVHANGLGGAFIFDDAPFIVNNPNIRSFSNLFERNAGQEARPTTYGSLALNYAIGELDPFGYHVVNLLIHLLAALILFAVIYKTLNLPLFDRKSTGHAAKIAFAISLIWAVHPLQSECVAYVFQRSESLQALFYLLSIYCYVQTETDDRHRRLWIACLIAVSALGMGSKSTFLTLPPVLALFGRVFLYPTWLQTAKRSGGVLFGVVAAVVALGVSMAGVHELAVDYMKHTPEEAVDFSVGYATRPLEYYLSQPTVILSYLKFAFWPDDLCLDYRFPPVDDTSQIIATSLLLLSLLVSTGLLLKKHPPLGFCLAFVFLVLAPTSLYWRLDLMFTYRMYLPLAGLVSFLVAACDGLIAKHLEGASSRMVAGLCFGGLVLVAAPLCARTIARNRQFRDQYTVFEHVVEICPENPRGQYNLANQLMEQAKGLERDRKHAESVAARDKAIHHYKQAIRHFPHYMAAHTNLAAAIALAGDLDEAIAYLTKVVEWNPEHNAARLNLAKCHRERGISEKRAGKEAAAKADLEKAVDHYIRALMKRPRHAGAHYGVGTSYYYLGRFEKAASFLETYVQHARIKPDALRFLGDALYRLGRYDAARAAVRRHLTMKPSSRWSRRFLEKIDKAIP